MINDATIVLSHSFDLGGKLSRQAQDRVNRSAEIYHEGGSKTLLMSGRKGFGEAFCYDEFHADKMKEHAVSLGVPEERIFLERESLETVGQAVFTKLLFKRSPELRRISVVSSDYHIPRVRHIFEHVYGPAFALSFDGVPSGLAQDGDTAGRERRSLDMFNSAFGKITPGDDRRMIETLFTEHIIYRNLQRLVRDYTGVDLKEMCLRKLQD